MLLAALGFSLMGGAAKLLKESFNAGQLVFWRNAVGICVLGVGFLIHPPIKKRRPDPLAHFPGFNGCHCIVHITLLHPSPSIRHGNDL